MKTLLIFWSYYFIENLQLKRNSAKDSARKKKKRLREKTKRLFFGDNFSYIESKRLPGHLLRNIAKSTAVFAARTVSLFTRFFGLTNEDTDVA